MRQRPPNKWGILFSVIFGIFMVILDATVVNVAFPTLRREFGVGVNESQWVISVYTMALGIATPLAGFLADRFGIKRIYITGLAPSSSARRSAAWFPRRRSRSSARRSTASGFSPPRALFRASAAALPCHSARQSSLAHSPQKSRGLRSASSASRSCSRLRSAQSWAAGWWTTTCGVGSSTSTCLSACSASAWPRTFSSSARASAESHWTFWALSPRRLASARCSSPPQSHRTRDLARRRCSASSPSGLSSSQPSR